jgi:hypothetical protein
MPVIYNSKMIIPGPLLEIRREIVRNDTGRITKQFYVIQAKGKLVAWKGSPNSTGQFWTGSYSPGPSDENISDISRLASLRTKMGALNNLFCDQGQWFEAQPFDGTASIKFQPRIKNIQFAQGKWFEYVEYTIDMEADTIIFGDVEICGLLTNVIPDETWSIEAADQIGRTYRLTHSVSSQQKTIFDASGIILAGNNGWERAKAIVIPYLGIRDTNKIYNTGVLNLLGWNAYNYFRSQHTDEGTGKFSVTETWLVYDNKQGGTTNLPPALDDFTINSRYAEDGTTQVNIDGNVTGLEIRDIVTGVGAQTRWQSASLYFNAYVFPDIFTRALNYSGIILNPLPLATTIGRNPIQGTISWSAQFSNRTIPLIPGAIREDITVIKDGGTDVFATIPVLGRPWGPVLQGMSTISEKTLSVNINAQLIATTMLAPIGIAPNTDGIVLSFAPVALQLFRQKDTISYSMETGKYSRNVVFVYQN